MVKKIILLLKFGLRKFAYFRINTHYFLNRFPVLAYISVNTTIPINKMRPKTNNQLVSYASLSTQNTTLNEIANIIFPINLLKATVSYFSFSTCGNILKPAIKNEPLPLDRMIPNVTNNTMIKIVPKIIITSSLAIS